MWFESVVSLVTSKPELSDMDEIEALLLAHEVQIEKFNQAHTEIAPWNLTKSNNLAGVTSDATLLANLTHSFNSNQQQASFPSNSGGFCVQSFRGRGGRNGNRSNRGGRGNVQCQVYLQVWT